MRYADTCLLLSLHVPDPGTPAALAWLEAAGDAPILTSQWTVVEFASALGILVRRGDITRETHAAALARFRRFTADRLTVETPEAADFELAAGWLVGSIRDRSARRRRVASGDLRSPFSNTLHRRWCPCPSRRDL